MSVVPYPVPQPGRPTWIDVMDRGVELAEIIANTEFVPKGLRGNQPAILAAIMYGHEVGLEPMQSLAKIAVIDGRPTLAAEAQRALILAAGHELWIEESTNTRAVVAARRTGSKLTQRVTWTLDDAKRARIAGKPNWQAYPRQMLVARASAELARQVFADVIGGMAATEELEDHVDGDTPTVETHSTVQALPKAGTTTRKRRRPPATPEPPPPPSPGPPPDKTNPEPAEPDPPSDASIRKLFALYNQKGLRDRDTRLVHAEKTLGRPITSSKELTALDVSRLIDALDQEPDTVIPPELPAEEQAVLDALEHELDAKPLNEEQDERPPLPDD